MACATCRGRGIVRTPYLPALPGTAYANLNAYLDQVIGPTHAPCPDCHHASPPRGPT